jgi:hypothetical protein
VSVTPSAASTQLTFTGTYTSTAGTLYVPDAEAWSHLKFRGDDAGALGEGTITFTVEADGGAVTGSLRGPLGPATLSGVADGSSLSFHVSPQGGDELSLSGTGTALLDGGAATGELHVSSWRGNVLREATFRAQRP